MVVAVLACAVSPAVAADINFTSVISQSDFKSFSQQIGALIAYRNLAPAEPLGISGFDVGVEVSAISVDKNSAYWRSAFSNDAPAYLGFPKLRVRKGLPYGFDIGAMYAYVPDSNIKLYGAELSKALLDGSAATPAIGVRATYSKLAGVDDLGLQTYGMDISISKGFVFLTPYAGAGIVRISSDAKGFLQAIGLKNETITTPRLFAGVKITPFPLFGITAEAEYTELPIYSLKAAISF
jgi:hypothetical protein